MELHELKYKYVNDGGKTLFYTPNEGEQILYASSETADPDNSYTCSIYKSGLVMISHTTANKITVFSNMEFEEDSKGHFFLKK